MSIENLKKNGIDLDGVLPEGNNGIAAKYLRDKGIESHPDVILADDFESCNCVDDLLKKWGFVAHRGNISINTDPVNCYRGTRSVQFEIPVQNNEISVEIGKNLTEELDVLFLRYYSKFDESFNVLGSSHNGGVILAHHLVNGRPTPGIASDGTNKFLACYENWRDDEKVPNPGHLNVYVYHAEQREGYGDHFFPSGRVLPRGDIPHDFGPDFRPRPDIIPELGRWYCYEFMLKANTPGKRDGRVACWLDGKLVADFPNIRFRDVDTIKIDRFVLNLHIKSNRFSATKKWYDHVVAAKSYIGPLAE